MSFCGQCGFQVEEGAKFCPSCGQPCGQAASLSKATLAQGSPLPQHEGISYAELLREKIIIIILVSVGLVLLAVIGWLIFFKPLGMYDYELEVEKITTTWAQSADALSSNRSRGDNYDFTGGAENQEVLEKYIKSSKKAMKQLSSLRAPKEYKAEDADIKAFAKHYLSVDLKRYKEGLGRVSTMKNYYEYMQFLLKDNSSSVHYRATNKYFDALSDLGIEMDEEFYEVLTIDPQTEDGDI